MNSISGMRPPAGLQQLLGVGGGAQAVPQGPPPIGGQGGDTSALKALEGNDGQSLLDIRDELKSAVQSAVEGFDGTGDLRSEVQSAVESALEENGFDVEEVRSAMESSFGGGPFGPGGMGGRGGSPFGGGSGGPGGMFGGNSAGAASGSMSDGLVQSFLEQFRSGSNLDLEI